MPDPITDKDELLPPLSFRRGLVFGTGFSLLLISIITVKNMWVYFDNNTTSINEFLLLIFSSWGISYVIFLWLTFFVIVIKKLPGCAWTVFLVVHCTQKHFGESIVLSVIDRKLSLIVSFKIRDILW